MIALQDRRSLAQDIRQARDAGVRLKQVCDVAGVDVRTLQRWKAQEGLIKGEGRPAALRPMPSQALSADERAKLVCVANEPRYCAVPPARIVPMLADESLNLTSESTFPRVLRAHGQTPAHCPHRHRRPPRSGAGT